MCAMRINSSSRGSISLPEITLDTFRNARKTGNAISLSCHGEILRPIGHLKALQMVLLDKDAGHHRRRNNLASLPAEIIQCPGPFPCIGMS